jgi:Flp pilus assembly protein TadB
MAQTKRKRRTKHRGNAAGQVETRGRTSRPASPEARKAQRKDEQRKARMDRYAKPPSWRSAANRALVATVLFVAVVVLAFGQPIQSAIALGGFLLLLYIPIGYFTDTFFYNRRQQQLAKKRGEGR